MKIGIHCGNVISGVVGENKPQFSLIGDTVNKSSRVCANCEAKRVVCSKEAQKMLEQHSNQYFYESFVANMKGIGIENVYIIRRARPQLHSRVFKKSKSPRLHFDHS